MADEIVERAAKRYASTQQWNWESMTDEARDECRTLASIVLGAEEMAPVQGYAAGIPWEMHMRAYDAYVRKYGPQEALIEGSCRGGFHAPELDELIPGWQKELTEIARLRETIGVLRKGLGELTSEVYGDPEAGVDGSREKLADALEANKTLTLALANVNRLVGHHDRIMERKDSVLATYKGQLRRAEAVNRLREAGLRYIVARGYTGAESVARDTLLQELNGLHTAWCGVNLETDGCKCGAEVVP